MDKTQKLKKLAQVARMYYIEDQKQSDIATAMGVSRPFVSRMLKEAKELNIIEIHIHEPEEGNEQLFRQLHSAYKIHGGLLVEDGEGEHQTNQALSNSALALLDTLKTKRLGLGWGYLMGEMVAQLEQRVPSASSVMTVCPMIGNAGVPIRHYQSSESVRVFAERLCATPHFFNLPALPEDCVEKQIFCGTESYRQISRQWELLDTAFVNIGNYPSTPDFASGARYGTLLQQKKTCGRLIAYFFNREGEIIQSDHDFALQIPIDSLRRCKNVVGLCSANTSVSALQGALNTGLFTHLVARATLVSELL